MPVGRRAPGPGQTRYPEHRARRGHRAHRPLGRRRTAHAQSGQRDRPGVWLSGAARGVPAGQRAASTAWPPGPPDTHRPDAVGQARARSLAPVHASHHPAGGLRPDELCPAAPNAPGGRRLVRAGLPRRPDPVPAIAGTPLVADGRRNQGAGVPGALRTASLGALRERGGAALHRPSQGPGA